jgi:hypothetical protein
VRAEVWSHKRAKRREAAKRRVRAPVVREQRDSKSGSLWVCGCVGVCKHIQQYTGAAGLVRVA